MYQKHVKFLKNRYKVKKNVKPSIKKQNMIIWYQKDTKGGEMEYKDIATNPVGVILQLVGAKWKLLIVKELLKKERRFVELKKTLGCTSKVLTSCLKEMEEDGLIVREEYEVLPPRVEYYLTDIGYTLRPVIESMQKWGKEYKRLRKLMDKYENKEIE